MPIKWIVLCAVLLTAALVVRAQDAPLIVSDAGFGGDPPVIAPSRTDSNSALVFWVGQDARGVHQDARRWTDGTLSDPVTLPIPPTGPTDQQAIALPDGGVLLFWRDRGTADGLSLFAARITPDLQVERGPTEVASGPVYAYDAVFDGGDGVIAVWSGGTPFEPTLTARRIDSSGRPLEAVPLGLVGLSPALTYDRAGVGLFWRESGEVWTVRLSGGETPNVTTTPDEVTTEPYLDRADVLFDFNAGSDGETIYLFWNIARRDGSAEAWMAAGRLDDPFWEPPARVIASGGVTATFARPLDQAADPLPVGLTTENGIEITAFRSGEAFSTSRTIAVRNSLRPPSLSATADGGLLIGWTEFVINVPRYSLTHMR